MAAFLVALITAPSAFGQLKDANGKIATPVAFVNLDPITVTLVPAPNLGGGNTANSGNGNSWLKVEFHYTTTELVTKEYPFVDAVQFKVWIEGLDQYAANANAPNGKGVAVALTGTVDYINVQMNRDIYGSFYVHPSVLARYGSDRGPEDFDRKFNIHVEAYVGGTLVDAVDRKKETDATWYQKLQAVPNLVLRQDQCPFVVADTTKYPLIKPQPTAP